MGSHGKITAKWTLFMHDGVYKGTSKRIIDEGCIRIVWTAVTTVSAASLITSFAWICAVGLTISWCLDHSMYP